MKNSNLDQLLLQYQSTGDPEALGALFDAAAPGLLRIARRLAPDSSGADDVLQETFLAVVTGVSDWDSARPAGPWLIGVLSHRAQSARRRSKREPEPDRLHQRETAEPWKDATDAEIDAAVRESVQVLPEKERALVVARLFEGLSGPELAERFGLTASGARTRLHRGLGRLREALPSGISLAALGFGLNAKNMAAMRAHVMNSARAGGAASRRALGASGAAAGATAVGAGVSGWMAWGTWTRSVAAIVGVAAAGFLGYTAWVGLQSQAKASMEAESYAEALSDAQPVPVMADAAAGIGAGALSNEASTEAAKSSAAQASTDESGRVALMTDLDGEADGEADGFVMQLDAGGQRVPAAGVEVHWSYEEPKEVRRNEADDARTLEAAGFPGLKPISAELQQLANLGGANVQTVSGTVRTNARGEFRLNEIPEGTTCTIDVPTDEFYREARAKGALDKWRQSSDPVELLRVPHGFLEGRAMDLEGLALKGVTVTAHGQGEDASNSAISEDDGRFHLFLRGERPRVEASLTGYVQVGRRVALALEEGGWESLDVVMARAGTLELNVGPGKNEDGEWPRKFAVVESWNQHDVDIGGSRFHPHEGEVDADGFATITGLPIGRKLVVLTNKQRCYAYQRNGSAETIPFSHSGGPPSGFRPIVIPESGRLRLALTDVQLHSIHGRVEDASGVAMSGVSVRATAAFISHDRAGSGAGETETDDSGTFSMSLAGYGDVGPVLFTVESESAGKVVDVTADPGAEVVLRVRAAEAMVSGRVELPTMEESDLKPALRLQLLEFATGTNPRRTLSESTSSVDEDGTFRMELPVAAGRYRLIATHPDFAAVEAEFDAPRAEPLPTLRFADRYDAELHVRLVSEDGSELSGGRITMQTLPFDTAAAPLRPEYSGPGGSSATSNTTGSEAALRARFPDLSDPWVKMVPRPHHTLTLRLQSGPAWIGATARLSSDQPRGERGSASTGEVLVPPGASDVTLRLRREVNVKGRLSTELLAKGSDLHLAVRPVGVPLDLELGRGPVGGTSPVVPVDQRGLFGFVVPAGTFECRLQDAAGTVLKTVQFQASLEDDEALVIE